jgi:hypothetical protein
MKEKSGCVTKRVFIVYSLVVTIISQLSFQSVTLYFVGFVWFSLKTAIITLQSIKQLLFVMVKCGVLFHVRTEFLITHTNFGFKGLISSPLGGDEEKIPRLLRE